MTNTVRMFGLCVALLASAALPTHAQRIVQLDTGPQKPDRLDDAAVEGYRLELLDLAWRAATSYPMNPHVKNRARAEEEVVLGALAVGRPQHAWEKANQVVNWRRGACYAEIAHYLINQDDTAHVEYFLQMAVRFSKDPLQGWRQDRVKARVAQARVVMGQAEQADGLVDEQDPANTSVKLSAQAGVAGEDDFDRLVEMCEKLIATEGYDAILGALSVYTDLYERFYANEQRRDELMQKIIAAWEPMPALKRIETLLRMSDVALTHGDTENAAQLVDQADAMRQSFAWTLDYHLRLAADVAQVRTRLGQRERAKQMLDQSLPLFEENKDKIENFYRAGALRPIAESYAKLGETEKAHALYAQVVELGAVNPNMRPRISDITATCISMAVHGVEPNAELFETIRDIVSGLGDS